MPTIPAIPGIQPTNPNPPQVSKTKAVVAPFGNVPSCSFADIKSSQNDKNKKGITNATSWRSPTKDKYRDDDDDDNEEASDDDDVSEQKTEAEDMSLVSQMQNSHVSEPSKDPTEDNIWAPTRKGQWLGQRTNATQKSSRGDASAATPNVTNVSGRRNHNDNERRPDQVVVKSNRRDSDTMGEASAAPSLPRVLEEVTSSSRQPGGQSGDQNEDIFDGVSMKSVNTFNCSEMNDLQSISGNSFNALMNGDDFSVSQRSIISELSDLQSIETKNQQHMYEKAVRQVNKEFDQYFNNATNPTEQQRVSQMYYEAVRQTYANFMAQQSHLQK